MVRGSSLCFKLLCVSDCMFLLGNSEEKPPSSSAPAPAGDAHANLMEAIRKAGGAGRAKLRPAADSTPAKVRVKDLFVFC